MLAGDRPTPPALGMDLLQTCAVAKSLGGLPTVTALIQEQPNIAQAAPSVDSGFPWGLQLQHFFNMVFMLFIMPAGLQILADHPQGHIARAASSFG